MARGASACPLLTALEEVLDGMPTDVDYFPTRAKALNGEPAEQ